MSCQSCQLMWAFRQQSSSYRSPVPKRGHICRCQPVTVREPFSLQFQFSPKCRSMKSVSFAMLKAENAGLWQTPQTCVCCWCCCLRLRGILFPVPVPGKTCRCQPVTAARKPFSSQFINEECLLHNAESWESWTLADTSDLASRTFLGCWCCCVTASRNCVFVTNPVFITHHIACSGLSKNEQSIAQASPCWKNIRTFITCASSMSCQSCQLMWAFRQQSSSYRSPVPKRGHICRCQPDTVREPFSLQFQFSPKFRSMKSVSFAMLKAENAGLWQTPQTCVKKIFWLLMLLFEASRNPVSSSSSRQNMQVSASDRYEKTVLFAVYQWRVSPSQCWKQRTLDSGRHLRPVSRRFFGCWCCCLRLRGILFPVPVPGKTCRCQPVTAARKPFSSQFINEECLLHNAESWESWTLADTSDLASRTFLGCWCCCVTASRNCVFVTNPVFITHHIACSGLSKNEQSIAQASPCWKNIRTFITCASSMSCQSCQLMWAFRQQSSSYRSPVPKRGHICRCQPDTVREPFSLQFQFSPKFRSMKSVSFGVLTEKAAQTLCQEDSWLLMLLFDGFQESLRYQEFPCMFQFRAFSGSRTRLPFPVREWAELCTTLAILEEQTLALIQCLASVAKE